LREKVIKLGLIPGFARLRRVNYYNSTALKNYVQKAENALITLNNNISESARKGAKEFLGQ